MPGSGHSHGSCIRAFGTLALAHGIVSTELAKALAPVSLCVNEFEVLASLVGHPDGAAPLAALVTAARLSQPAVSRLIGRLEKRGLLERVDCPRDRRSVTVRLTAAGRSLAAMAIPLHENCIREKLLACLSAEEADVLRTALLKIADANTAQARDM